MVFKISDVINFMTEFYFCSDFLSRTLGAETGLRPISCYGITSPRERFGALQMNFLSSLDSWLKCQTKPLCAYFFSLFISSKTSIQVLCFCFATSYFSASCHWWCTFFAMLLFWSPRAHCASALLACVGRRVWEWNTGCLNRCYQGFKFQNGSDVPHGYLFY